MYGAELVRWTIWISLAGYALCLGLILRGRPGESRRLQLTRLAWSVGCLFLWLHVAAAFHWHHDWSHAAAYEHTARETALVTGLRWGGGIYFNYFTMLLWAGDASWWWIAPASYARRAGVITAIVHGWLAFMIVNATVVFESGPVRWVAMGMILLAAVMAAGSKR